MIRNYEYTLAGSAYEGATVITQYAMVLCEGGEMALDIPECLPFVGDWGCASMTHIMDKTSYPLPIALRVVYLSVAERKWYMGEGEISVSLLKELWSNTSCANESEKFEEIVVGMAPYGGLAVWARGLKKQVLVNWFDAVELDAGGPNNITYHKSQTLEICRCYDDLCSPQVRSSLSKEYMNSCMQQYTYRYLVWFDTWLEQEQRWVEEKQSHCEVLFIEDDCFDGCFNRERGDSLLRYHKVGIPRKVVLNYTCDKANYMVCFWMDMEKLHLQFEQVCADNKEAQLDLLVHIDTQANRYELALYKYGMEKPCSMSEESFQCIVIKNGFEEYRTPNYNKPRGAWSL